ncbi:HD domain-containing phosphohydrolase [Dehalobacterium formicoaceticum]|uniref:HD domain-containing phosphohydrolase n=1 Tax=Dehalobacterium formicoaceticum TaxID=51515 RepID=UPI0031F7000C
MSKLSAQVKIYIALVTMLAAALVLRYVPHFYVAQEDILVIILFVLISVFSEYMAVTMPFVGMISVSFAIDLAAIMIFGIPGAIMITSLGYIGSFILNIHSDERSLDKFVFNLSLFIITVTVSGLAYQDAINFFGDKDHWHLIAALLAAVVFYLINATLLAILFSFLKKKSLGTIWIMNMRWAVPNLGVLAPIGYMLAYIYPHVGALGILFFFLPLLLARHTFKLYMDMRNMYLNSIKSMAAIIDAKDHYTAGHSERVTKYVLMICYEMGLDEEYIENLKDMALLHDIGKIGIPEQILNKPGRLNEEEYSKMKTHPVSGYDIVKNITFLKNPEVCKYHHERIDGKGYPEGLTGELIPLGARIISVADAFDAMTTNRPYRKGMDPAAALKELERCQGTQFDQKVVTALTRAMEGMETPE